MEDITIKTEDEMRVSVDSWSPSAIYLHIAGHHQSAGAVLTRSEALQVIAALKDQLGALA